MINGSTSLGVVRQSRTFPKLRLFALSLVFLWAGSVCAQVSPQDHAEHHPDQKAGQPSASDAKPTASPKPGSPMAIPAPSASPMTGASPAPAGMTGMPSSPASPAPGGMGGQAGGMMEGGMEKMMEAMGAPPPKELYPSLMDLPNLPPERRAEIERLAHERMTASREQMSAAATRLSDAAMRDDYAAMQQATAQMREALAQFESGLAVHRALAEGKAPRNIALQWFKQDMNLLPAAGTEPRALLGVTPFHLFTMVLLIAFALAMVAMYFFKMRRTVALFGRIEPDKGAPPPGSAPELAGGKPPSGEKPPASDNKPAAPADKPAADAPPTAP